MQLGWPAFWDGGRRFVTRWAEPGLRVRPCKMVVGRGWMEVQGMSDGEVYSCQFLLKSTSGCFRSWGGPSWSARSIPHPNKPRQKTLVWISSQFWDIKSIFPRFFCRASALFDDYTRMWESLQTCQPCCQIPHTDAKIGQITENVPLSNYHPESRCVRCFCAAIKHWDFVTFLLRQKPTAEEINSLCQPYITSRLVFCFFP